MKKKILFVIIGIVLGFAIISFGFFTKSREFVQNSTKTLNGLPVYESSGIMAYNMSNINEAVGAVEYVFVAKINNIDRTEYRNSMEVESNADGSLKKEIADPYTVYTIEVIENIKGNLVIGENIELVQNGGLNQDGKSYTFLDGGSLLEVGQYYVILAFVPSSAEGELLIHNKYTYEKININADSVSSYDLNLNENAVVNKYKSAYDNEIVPDTKTTHYLSMYDNSLH